MTVTAIERQGNDLVIKGKISHHADDRQAPPRRGAQCASAARLPQSTIRVSLLFRRGG